MKIRLLSIYLFLGFALLAAGGDLGKQLIPSREVQTYCRTLAKIDPTKSNLWSEILLHFGRKDFYSAEEIQFVQVPKVDVPTRPGERPVTIADLNRDVKLPRTLPAPVDTFTPDQLEAHWKRLAEVDGPIKASLTAMRLRFGNQAWYTAAEVRLVEATGAEEPKIAPQKKNRDETAAIARAHREANYYTRARSRWRSPLIRRYWTEAFAHEDPTQEGQPQDQELQGAIFSFSRDNKSKSITWTAIASVAWPYIGEIAPSGENHLASYAIVPSVSLNRIAKARRDSNGNQDREGNTNELFYRLGAVLEWVSPFGAGKPLTELSFRGSAVYLTDTRHRASAPAFEFELEPKFGFPSSRDGSSIPRWSEHFKIGYRNILLGKQPLREDGSDRSLLDYAVRMTFRAEGGKIQRIGSEWTATKGGFFRLGPTLSLEVNLPTVLRGLTFTGGFSHLAALEGTTRHSTRIEAGADLTLYEEAAPRRKVGLSLKYIRGGLDFTKQDVDSLTIGLSVLY